ncbi:F0F1 ATP synthase subunit epsilon [Maridesulfovibrio ferrireducens]|uniref:F0F1 ATP synthase subunit epsilon n=1 Tax=Maridesulfovibrio ferrireducens TaxID=246191 RepID=UPI001A34B697|nr:F0F1 ATP synthase subunit epsilon [Maridesulfovibrio ferrireducens]MBI9113112.1 F0F1 ATP synthase subunit epsilon [Maridesulfovibrio ferrireducens]
MKFKIMLPSGIFLDCEADKIVAECTIGGFCLLPNHVDMATALSPGILTYYHQGTAISLAVDAGILIKKGRLVRISSHAAVKGELGELELEVDRMLEDASEAEKAARTTVAKLEAGFIRSLIEVETV